MKQILVLILLCPLIAFADEPTCTSGKPSQSNLVDQLSKAKTDSPITKIISKTYKLDIVPVEGQIKEECTDGCESSTPAGATQAAAAIGAIPTTTPLVPKAPTLALKTECMQISDQFKSTESFEYSCPDGKKQRNRGMCITVDLLKYQNAAISNMISCMASLGFSAVDSNSIFQKYSIESTFKPQYSSTGGVGIGQLTNIFVDDIHQVGRGFEYLKQVADSTNPECEAAKIIAAKDISKKPNLNFRCQFMSMGEGMERNILYSMIGITTVWEKNLEPTFRKYLNKYADHPQLAEAKRLGIMNAYGSGGPAAAMAAIRRLSSLPPDKFVQAIKKPLYTKSKTNLTQYTSNIARRQRDIAKLLPADLQSLYAEKGPEACINRF